MSYLTDSLRVPGLLVSMSAKLLLRFQFNPMSLGLDKSNNYQTIPIPGWTQPALVWAGGNVRTVSWELYFDSLHKPASTGGTGQLIPGLGVRDVQAMLESFLYPEDPLPSVTVAAIKAHLSSNVSKFTPPPVATFIFGPNWWQGYLSISNMQLTNFDRLLTPRRLTCMCTLQVLDYASGIFLTKETETRRALATVGYPLNRAPEILGTIEEVLGAAAMSIGQGTIL